MSRTGSGSPRLLKKYPNRRLYDLVASRYVTFDDIRFLVLKDVHFVVIDHRTEEDLTDRTLLQILAANDGSVSGTLCRETLRRAIRGQATDAGK